MCIFSNSDVRFFREQVERKTAGEKRIGSLGNDWEGRQLGNWFLWVAHGSGLCTRRGLKSSGRFGEYRVRNWPLQGVVGMERNKATKVFFWILLQGD